MSTPVRAGVNIAVVAALVTLCAGCHSGTSPAAPTTTPSSVAVTGTTPAVGQSGQLDATATLSNGTTEDVTTQATWSSSNTTVATVTSGGLLTVLALGNATITATYQSASGTFSVGAALTVVTVSGPASLTVPQQYQFTAVAHFSDGTSQDVTDQATWSQTAYTSSVFTVSAQGLVQTFWPTNTATSFNVTATYQSTTGQAAIQVVMPCQLSSLSGDFPSEIVLGPTNLRFTPPSSGGSYTFNVQGPANCSWITLPVDGLLNVVPSSFVTVTAGASGAGSGVVSFTIAPDAPDGVVRLIPSAAANLPLDVQLQVGSFAFVDW